jgi:hypothetical protein
MDPKVLRLLACVDQTRAGMRDTVRQMTRREQVDLIKTCAKGELADLDEREMRLVGLLAALCIIELLDRSLIE